MYIYYLCFNALPSEHSSCDNRELTTIIKQIGTHLGLF